MKESHFKSMAIFSASLILGMGLLGAFLGSSLIRFRSFERTVIVKGLSEREYPADIIICPVPVIAAGGEAAALYTLLDRNASRVRSFFIEGGVSENEISISIPNVVDKAAREYGDSGTGPRFTGKIVVTVYSTNVGLVQGVLNKIGALGKEGIVLQLGGFDSSIEYMFSKLNEVKPEMIKEASANAKDAAQQFAKDSGSRLGKLKTASQGQFSISPRDGNTPHLKTVRVVTSMEYYLND